MYKATQKDIERVKRVIEEQFKKNNKDAYKSSIDKIAEEVLNTSYSIGGGYDEGTIRKIVESYIKRDIF